MTPTDTARPPRLAVLIDADNVSAAYADALFDEIATLGDASVRRIYGDFASSRLKKWSDVLARHAILPHQQFAYTQGKNASDMALVIDAMTLLFSGHVDGFCLVSSDSDFTRLATEIRERGMMVYGFGDRKTPESLRSACHRFIYLGNLGKSGPNPAAPDDEAKTAPVRQPPSKAIPLINSAIDQIESDSEWVNLGEVGNLLFKLRSDFDSRSYGEPKLSDLVRKTGSFDMKSENQAVLIRRRPKAK